MRFFRLRPFLMVLAMSAALLPHAARAAEVSCADHNDPRLNSMTDDGIQYTSALGLAPGRYVLPADITPTTLVVMFHGHGNDTCSWRKHLQDAAGHGAIAVAMDYTGTEKRGTIDNYGWFMRNAAADSIAAAQYFKAHYPSVRRVIAFGVSMGGNASGLAVAESNIFDYWIDAEGVNNLVEEYFVARGVAPVNSGGAVAQQEIEEENGGSFEEVPEKYLEITNVARVQDMSYLKGAVIINGFDDGLVPSDQTDQMTAGLTAVGVPTHEYKVLLRGSGESGTTFTAIPGGPLFGALGQSYESPFAGHAWEGSDTHLIMKKSLEELWRLIPGDSVAAGVEVIGTDPPSN